MRDPDLYPPVPTVLPALAWVAAVVGIAGQIGYPLCDTPTQTLLTGLTVTAFFLAMAAATCATFGPARGLPAIAVGCVLSWTVELLGARTGFPFGDYRYTGSLRPTLAGVPVIVPLAWTAMALAALAVARRLFGARWLAVALVGGGALASWDIFLDPQMVAAGHWSWRDPQWTLPGVRGIPLSNFAGWLVVAVLLVGLLARILPANPPLFGELRPVGRSTWALVAGTVYLWTYGSELLAGFAFFHRPAVAVVGGVLMGAFAIPYVCRLASPYAFYLRLPR